MDAYPYKDGMEDARIKDERECQWRVVFEEKTGGIDDEK